MTRYVDGDREIKPLRSRQIKGRAQAGFGLVEILISLVLGLILTFGMTNIFLTSKQAYRTQDALSGVQQNGRYAMEVLTRNIRMAGYQGCANLDAVTPNVIANNMPGSGTFNNSQVVRGYEADGNFTNDYPGANDPGQAAPGLIITGTDMITLNGAMDCGTNLQDPMLSDSSDIELNSGTACDLDAGKEYLLLITDCKSSDLFRTSGVTKTSDTITIKHAGTKNSTSQLSKPYGTDAQIFRYTQSDYYLGTNAVGEPALYWRENGDNANRQELVEGVEVLQLLYGEDTNNDLAVDRYVDESGVGNWANVYSVRLALTLRSQTTNITLDDTDPERRMRQNMTATVGLRNKLP